MKFLIDECLSHHYAQALADRGYPDTIHPIHVGLRGLRDVKIVERALFDDRVIVTVNGRDYRKLLAKMPLHPGAIIAEALDNELTWQLILAALAYIEIQTNPADYMVNRVVEVSLADGVRPYRLASGTA